MLSMRTLKNWLNNVKSYCNMNDAGIYILGVLVGIFFGCATMLIIESFYPTAIDVYQGKTTLEYTIVDGVKVDSTVVWKNNQ